MLPRKITSLQEDMQKLGLTKLVDSDINGKTSQRKPVTESREQPVRTAPKTAKEISEAKQQIKARKERASKIRESRMAKKLAMYETRLQRIERTAKKTGHKVESKIKFIKGLNKRATVMESYDVRKELGADKLTAKALAESFGKVASLSGTLGRAFGCMEQFFGEEEASLGIPVIHPDSAYGYDLDHSNAANNAGSGEVTDYGTEKANEGDDAEPKDDMDEADDDMDVDAVKKEDDGDDDKKKDDLDLGEDDADDDDKEAVKEDDDMDDDDKKMEDDAEDDDKDAVKEDDGDDDEDDKKTEDDEPSDADKKKMEARRKRTEARALRLPMDYELHTIRLEAEDMATKVGGSGENVNLGYASSLMNDMVSYLGGAMKLYFKLQQSMKSMGYVGQDQPVDAGAAPVPTAQPNNAYIGTVDKPQGETAIDQGGASNAPKVGDATDTSGVKEPKAESKKPAAKK